MAEGIKKSEFTASSSIAAGSTFDFVTTNGDNIKIAVEDLLAALGVSGTLLQAGAVTGTPILQPDGPNYNIRNLEPGNGISTTISAENGVAIKHDFVNGSGGVDVIKDINVAQPIVRNIQGGNVISISVDDDTDSVLVTATGEEVVTTKTVTVSSISDLPTPVGGVITLAPDGATDYLFVNDISTSNRFALATANPVSIRAAGASLIELEYTGSSDMFTGSDPKVKFVGIKLSCPNGNLFNTTSSVSGSLVQMVECNVGECETLGTISGNFITRFTNVAFENIKTNGLTMGGANSNLVIETAIAFLNGGIFLDLNSATFNSVNISGVTLETSAAGTTFLNGLDGSGNINSGGLGTLINTRINGSAKPITGLRDDAFNASSTTYSGSSFSVLSQENTPASVAFSSDGTSMYIVGITNDTVYQYTLSTAFDVSTASYASKSFSVATQEGQPNGLTFNNDGTSMYVVGPANATVYQYTLSTAFDVSTASYSTKSFSVLAQEGQPREVAFSSDGTSMYVVGTGNDTVYQYTLSTAFDVSTASYASKSFSVTTQEGQPHGLTFNNDGTSMYVVGTASDSVYQYTLSTAFDVSTASYSGKQHYFGSRGDSAAGVVFNNNGTRLFAVDFGTDFIYEYEMLSISPARWEFILNDGIEDSRTDALLAFQGNTTNTVISTLSVPVKVTADWNTIHSDRAATDLSGRVTFTGGKREEVAVSASLSVSPASGTNVSISAYLAKNGTVLPLSERRGTASSGSPTSITIPWQIGLENGDYVELYVANESNTTDILVSSAVLRVG